MKILGMDSSGLVASVAVVEDDNLLAEYTVNYKKTHSQTLLPMLDEIVKMVELDLDSIDAIAVAGGPGSFTGLRIGSATAKGLGFSLQKPLIRIPTVDGLAYNLYGCRDMVCPLMDARRNQTYTGLYEFNERGMEVLERQCAVAIEEIIEKINKRNRPVVFLGDGVKVFRSFIQENCRVSFSFAPAHVNKQRAAAIASLGLIYFQHGKTVAAAEFAPDYLRLSQAERERLEKIHYRMMKEEDILAVADIERQVFSMPWSAQSFQAALQEESLFVVALDGDTVVGYGGMYRSFEEGEITNVAVAPAMHNQGIGHGIMKYLLEQAWKKDITRIVLEVRVSNVNAIHLYESIGFLNCGIRKDFYEKPREDGIVMALEKSDIHA